MTTIREVRYSDKKAIKDLSCGTIFKYQDAWYTRCDTYLVDWDYQFDLSGHYNKSVHNLIPCNAVDLVTGKAVCLNEVAHPEAVADELDVKLCV